jgi:hypothetical protein
MIPIPDGRVPLLRFRPAAQRAWLPAVGWHAEPVTALRDSVNRMKDDTFSRRGIPIPRFARIEVGEPIPVARFEAIYQAKRRSGVAELTAEILRVFRRKTERGGGPGGAEGRAAVPVLGSA